MSITINDRELERRLTALARRQMVPSNKSAMAMAILREAVSDERGGPINAWRDRTQAFASKLANPSDPPFDVQAGKQPVTGTYHGIVPGPRAVPACSHSPLDDRPADADPAQAGTPAADQTTPTGRAGPASGAAFDPPAASPAHDSPGEAA
jgi:hypothetical protein